MSMATIGIVAGIAFAGTGLGMSLSGAGQPQYPNIGSSSTQLSNLQAQLLPDQRRLQAAAQSGESTLNYGYSVSTDGNKYRAKLQSKINSLKDKKDTDKNRSLIADYQQQLDSIGEDGSGTVYLNSKGKLVPQSEAVANFKGYGTADVQGTIAGQNAKNNLALSQKYDSQYIAEAKREQDLADPQSVAAREVESQFIQEQANRPENNPVADTLDAQVGDTLRAADENRLTGMDQSRLDSAVAEALSGRGVDAGGAADFSQPLTTGFAGEQRQQQAAQNAIGFLASGSSPEDIAYRREQQNLANLSAEVNGRTPESEFASMSGAQSGPTPVRTASALPTLPGSSSGADAVAIQNANTQGNLMNSQADGWMAGLSSLINTGSAAAKLGWQPFQGNNSSN